MLDLLRLRPLALVPCLLLLPACPGKEGLLTDFDPSTTGETPETSTGGASSTSNSASTGGGVTTFDPSTETASPGETEGTAGTDTTFDPEDPPPQTVTSFTGGEETTGPEFPANLCADLGCGPDQLCVNPGPWCDYRLDPPDFVDVPPYCADFPAHCEMGMGLDFDLCLGEEFCTLGELPIYADEHHVYCGGAADCI
ncbi:hypothetical protein [Nannocystis punicea]|uniref:Uncharacterized protein n=1 Tax=Nannocystis punicea TaxID=2995304 RepID=A0ABY7H8E9_9BACT|nr:hypothetical protein [Nannocystis poenicansa]WAS95548.1 hypothetical protein O0S08_05245 [Nannocystis poenicansa]